MEREIIVTVNTEKVKLLIVAIQWTGPHHLFSIGEWGKSALRKWQLK